MIRAVNLQGAVRADEMNNRVRFCNGGESLPLSLSLYLSFLRNKNKTGENTRCEKIFVIFLFVEQNYRIEGSTFDEQVMRRRVRLLLFEITKVRIIPSFENIVVPRVISLRDDHDVLKKWDRDPVKKFKEKFYDFNCPSFKIQKIRLKIKHTYPQNLSLRGDIKITSLLNFC